MFKIGDIVTGKPHNGCTHTSHKSLMIVTGVNGCGIDVIIVATNDNWTAEVIGQGYSDIHNDRFEKITCEEFFEKYPNCSGWSQEDITKLSTSYITKQDRKEQYIKSILSDETRSQLLKP